ncbi:methyltransferase [Endozoicomonas sp. OPT23]|uniref:O-methyltransferase n=1 Tax=Endozoicomonas sp. OPT23 TaxID=2072845 RepID=UPI00129AE374|nr:O-methyltransferase [Endozoicomonas sp. OPT23]MRI34593.1 methyltransferase [Endozoicomonas sp. OPT23]
MTVITQPEIEQYCQSITGESESLQALSAATEERTRYPGNMSGNLVGQTLKMLVAISSSKRVLEIGMFTGYAALSMAEALPEGGEIYCCETNPQAIEVAEEFFQKSGQGNKLKVLFGRALDTIPTIEGELDFVFIDADKKKYREYVDLVLPMVRKGGLIVVDDALWKGGVLDPQDERDQIIADLNQYFSGRVDLENVLLPIRHGLHIIRKTYA